MHSSQHDNAMQKHRVYDNAFVMAEKWMQRALQQIAVVNFVHDKHDFHKPFSIQNFKIEYFCFYFDYKKKVIKVSLKLRISILCQ